MKKPRYQYSVYDTIENKYLVIDGNNADVEMAAGLRKEKLSTYNQGKPLYKGRYRITASEIDKMPALEMSENKSINSEDKKVMEEFNRTMKYISENYPPAFLRKILIVKGEERQAAG